MSDHVNAAYAEILNAITDLEDEHGVIELEHDPVEDRGTSEESADAGLDYAKHILRHLLSSAGGDDGK